MALEKGPGGDQKLIQISCEMAERTEPNGCIEYDRAHAIRQNEIPIAPAPAEGFATAMAVVFSAIWTDGY